MTLSQAINRVDAFLDRFHNHTVAALFTASVVARFCRTGVELHVRVLPRGESGILLLLVFVIAVLWFRDALRGRSKGA